MNFIFPFQSDHKRERGNFWYDRGEYNMAIQLYRRSLEYLDDTDKYVGDNSKLEEVYTFFFLLVLTMRAITQRYHFF